MSTTELAWFKSSYSGGAGDNCVEVALTQEAVHVRDSKDTRIQALRMSPTAWSAFTAHASGSAR
ncbi:MULTISPECIES: DUF397 domain-containing protein [unclassified Streptomyces]|uniref:DUF397 domain-containing protein n=1 Tax=unclassified Streptomyces TaxID=2593676 RepID=UPI001489D3C5|nr:MULTISPECIES: DUF397 domain-containing protein [unclassified Streptomyces]